MKNENLSKFCMRKVNSYLITAFPKSFRCTILWANYVIIRMWLMMHGGLLWIVHPWNNRKNHKHLIQMLQGMRSTLYDVFGTHFYMPSSLILAVSYVFSMANPFKCSSLCRPWVAINHWQKGAMPHWKDWDFLSCSFFPTYRTKDFFAEHFIFIC